jgi:glutaryl-CoA dehydrogenase (non-decarboxylating)
MMNFNLTEEQLNVQKMVRKCVDIEIIPYIQE